MHIVFDLSGTVLGAMDKSLRPGIKDTIFELRDRGWRVEFWTSGRTDDYAAILEANGIAGPVHTKRRFEGFNPDICVDDEPQEWMPGVAFKVDIHLDSDLPGKVIEAAELIECLAERGKAYNGFDEYLDNTESAP